MNRQIQIIELCEVNSRICPKPQFWDKLWKLLKNKKQVGMGWNPPLPLILAAWHNTTELQKKERLFEHIKWAEKQNQIEEIYDYLVSLNENQWYHKNE